MELAEYAALDGVDLANLVRTGDLSPREPAETARRAAGRVNLQLNAIIGWTEGESERALSMLDPRAPFAGVPFLVKDLGMSMAGIPQQMGSRFVEDYVPPSDSELARRCKEAGLVTIGRTNTPEFGCNLSTEPRLFGPTRNPWKPTHSAAGSSGGAAAAVAAGIVPFAHANDGGGSIRAPASACGLVGLKPSRGRLPAAPDGEGMVFGLGCEFVVSRSIRDSAAMLDALAAPDRGGKHQLLDGPPAFLASLGTAPRKLRIAVTTQTSAFPPTHPECVAAVERVAHYCESLGHSVAWHESPVDVGEGIRLWMHFSSAYGARMIGLMERAFGRKAERRLFERSVYGLFAAGRRLTLQTFLDGYDRMNQVTRGMASLFELFDLWLTPTLLQPPPELGILNADDRRLDTEQTILRWGGWAGFMPLYNVSGQPGITLPLHWSADGLPIGVHFGARLGDEVTLLQIAAQLEHAMPWKGRRPEVHVAH